MAIFLRPLCCPNYKTTVRLCNLLTIKWHYIFFLLRRFVLFLITYKTFYQTFQITRRVSFKKQEMLTFRKHVGSSPFFDGAVGLILLVFVVALCFYVLSFFVLCLMCPMLPVSLGFSFLVARSVFPNVYLNLCSRDEGHSRHASCALNSVCTIILHFPQNSSITLNLVDTNRI